MTGARYRLGPVLARGGTSEVYEAWSLGQGGFERRVVLKRLLNDLEPVWLKVFEEEARLLGRLDHPGIVRIIDYGDIEGQPFQALERLDGEPLSELVTQAGPQRPMPASAALEVIRRVARTLRDLHTHALGPIVHADLSPENVIISWRGEVKLLDFGCAHWPERQTQLPENIVYGKLNYLSPEQRLGRIPGPKADLFALGCILHFALTGQSLLQSENALQKVMEGVLPRIDASVATPVASLIRRACHPEVPRRMDSAKGFIAALDSAAQQLENAVRGDDALVEWLESVKPKAPDESSRKSHRLEEMFLLDSGQDLPPDRLGQSLVISGGDFPEDAGTVRAAVPTLVEVDGPTMADQPLSETMSTPVEVRWPKLVGYQCLVSVARAGNGELFLSRAVSGTARTTDMVLLKRYGAECSRWPLHLKEGLLLEARAMLQSPHEHLLQVLGVGTHEGYLALVVEYLAGRSLRRVLDDSQAHGQKLDREEILTIALAMARGLEAAHNLRRQLGPPLDRVPWSIEPHHVFISHTGNTKLVDFGFESAAERLETVGPQGLSAEDAQTQSIQALGQVIFEMLAGAPPEAYDRRSPTARHGRRDERLDQIVQVAQKNADHIDISRLAGQLALYAQNAGLSTSRSVLARTMRRLYGDDIDRERAFVRQGNLDRADSSSIPSYATDEGMVHSGPPTGDLTPPPVIDADIPTAPSDSFNVPTTLRGLADGQTATNIVSPSSPVHTVTHPANRAVRASGSNPEISRAHPQVPRSSRSSGSHPEMARASRSQGVIVRPSTSSEGAVIRPSASSEGVIVRPAASQERIRSTVFESESGPMLSPTMATPRSSRSTSPVPPASQGAGWGLQILVGLALLLGVAAGIVLYLTELS